jgi:iron complex outermembrane receptor protein
MPKRPIHAVLLAGAACVLAVPVAAWAQSTQAPGTEAPSEDKARVGEIVVTAQRRSEAISQVPIAITAITGKELKAEGVQNLNDLPDLVPGLRTLSPGGGSNSDVFIRGVGQQDISYYQEPPVASYFDGAYIGISTALAQPIYDVDRIEVLKGPQGTLFGRNATGGLIQFVSKAPSDQVSGFISQEVGSYGKFITEGAVGGPIVGDLTARASFHTETGGAYEQNTGGGPNTGEVKAFAGRLQLHWTPSARFDVSAELSGVDWPNQASPVGSMTRLQLSASGVPIAPPSLAAYQAYCQALVGATPKTAGPFGDCYYTQSDPFHTNTPGTVNFHQSYLSGIITANYKIANNSTITSITNYQQVWNVALTIPFGHTGTDGFTSYETQPYANQWSEELRLSTILPQARFTAGLYGIDIDNSASDDVDLTELPQYGIETLAAMRVKTESVAAFSEINYDFAPNLTLILGGRVTYDHKTADNVSSCTSPYGVCALIAASSPVPLVQFVGYKASISDTLFSYRAVLQWKPVEGLMTYAGVNSGNKGGGFNGFGPEFYPVSQATFKPETLTSYEAGFKARLLDHVISIDGAVFYYDYHDYQTYSDVNAVLQDFNVNANIKGADLDVVYTPIRGLQLTAGLDALDSTQMNVPTPTGKANFPMPEAPNLSINDSIRYTRDVAGGGLSFTLRHNYVSRRTVTAIEYIAEDFPAYNRVDFDMSYVTADGHWTVSFDIRNMLNATIYTASIPFVAITGTAYTPVAPPRFFSGSLKYEF